jgi:hypothetical protein
VEGLEEVAGFAGVFVGEVGGFGGVILEVVELEAVVFEEYDELPVAVADGAGGAAALVAVVGVMPEEGAVLRGGRDRRAVGGFVV